MSETIGKLSNLEYRVGNSDNYYWLDEHGKQVSESEILEAFGKTDEKQEVEGIWRNNESDMPVKITGIIGSHGNETYYVAEGSQTGIPGSQIEWNTQNENALGNTQLSEEVQQLRSQLEQDRQNHQEEIQNLNQKIDNLAEMLNSVVARLEATTGVPQTLVQPEQQAPVASTETDAADSPRETTLEGLFNSGDNVSIIIGNGNTIINGTVQPERTTDPDGETLVSVLPEGSEEPVYVHPDSLRPSEVPAARVRIAPAAASREVAPAARVTETTTTTETRERRDRPSRGRIAAALGGLVAGLLLGSGVVAACDRVNDSPPSSGGSMEAVSGSHVDFYNTDPSHRLTGVMLPKKASLKHNSNGGASIVDKDGKAVISKVEWDRQGNLSKATRNQLSKKGYMLVQGKLGDRYITIAGKK